MPTHAASATKRRGPLTALLAGVALAVAIGIVVIVSTSGARPDELVEGKATTSATRPPPSSPRASPPSSPLGPPPPIPMATSAAPPDGALQSAFETLRGQTAGAIGIVILPIGSAAPVVLGDWSDGAAWSTSKVPLSIAALRADPTVAGSVASAITASDNAAAEALWSSLGDPTTAASKVEAVLREAGDPTTVQTERVAGPQFSAFGQTRWALDHQAGFMAWLACHTRDQAVAQVWDLMDRISSDQRWGLGGIPSTRFKGGWGPSAAGYLVRQLGVIDQGGRLTAVAIASDGNSFGSGIGDLNAIAGFLNQHLAELPTGSCTPE